MQLKVMEIVSTLNLAFSENEKAGTTCNFQNMAINYFAIPHDLIRKLCINAILS